MDKKEMLNHVRLEERARILAKASQDVTKMLSNLNVSSSKPTKKAPKPTCSTGKSKPKVVSIKTKSVTNPSTTTKKPGSSTLQKSTEKKKSEPSLKAKNTEKGAAKAKGSAPPTQKKANSTVVVKNASGQSTVKVCNSANKVTVQVSTASKPNINGKSTRPKNKNSCSLKSTKPKQCNQTSSKPAPPALSAASKKIRGSNKYIHSNSGHRNSVQNTRGSQSLSSLHNKPYGQRPVSGLSNADTMNLAQPRYPINPYNQPSNDAPPPYDFATQPLPSNLHNIYNTNAVGAVPPHAFPQPIAPVFGQPPSYHPHVPIHNQPPPMYVPPLQQVPTFQRHPFTSSIRDSSSYQNKIRITNVNTDATTNLKREETQIHLYDIVKELASPKCARFFLNLNVLSTNIRLHPDVVLKIVNQNKGMFSMSKSNQSTWISLRPAIILCQDYAQPKGCTKPKCFSLHMCLDYLTNTCKQNENCIFGHKINSGHNNFIFHSFFLDKISPERLTKLVQNVLVSKDQYPKICLEYNKNKCNSCDCMDLHVCLPYVETLGKCPLGADCPFNHNILENKCCQMLRKFGISTNESKLDMLRIVAKNCVNKEVASEIEELSTFTENLDNSEVKQTTLINKRAKKKRVKKRKTNQDKKANKCIEKEDSSEFSDEEVTAQEPSGSQVLLNENVELGAEKQDVTSVKNTVISSDLVGNVDRALICHLAIDEKCNYAKRNCKYLHAFDSYYWQFMNDDTWYNFPGYYAEILEIRYMEPDCDKFTLNKLRPEYLSENQKTLVQFLEGDTLKVDFINMIVTNEALNKNYYIRHLSTPSHVTRDCKNSTVFNWYMKVTTDKWTLINRNESHIVVEKAYVENPKGKIIVTLNGVDFEIDFANMTLLNTKTGIVNSIKRRPEPRALKARISINPTQIQKPESEPESLQHNGYRQVKLDPESKEFKGISQMFHLSLPMNKIIDIHRIMNVALTRNFKAKQAALDNNEDCVSMKTLRLYYGVEQLVTDGDICANNLDPNSHIDDSYGKGIHFYNRAAAAAAKRPADTNETRNLFVFDVLVGQLTPGQKGSTRPSINPFVDPINDTSTDDVNDPSIFVKYHKDEYCPVYIIQFA